MFVHTHSHTHTQIHTLTLSHSHSDTHSHTLTLTLRYTLIHSHTHTGITNAAFRVLIKGPSSEKLSCADSPVKFVYERDIDQDKAPYLTLYTYDNRIREVDYNTILKQLEENPMVSMCVYTRAHVCVCMCVCVCVCVCVPLYEYLYIFHFLCKNSFTHSLLEEEEEEGEDKLLTITI